VSEEKFDRRSQYWFGLKDKGGYIHRERLRNQGYAPDVFDGRPVIGIANTWSELNPCNGSLDDVAEAVKRGVWKLAVFHLSFQRCHLVNHYNDQPQCYIATCLRWRLRS
jgi:dihydroxy-acid dehydratase